MRNSIPPSHIESPQHKRVTIRNRQMGKFAFARTNFWNNNRSCYSVWNQHMGMAEVRRREKMGREPCWHFRPPVHGNLIGASYIVFSYGTHFPLYVYDNKSGLWFENNESYSQTTTQHLTYARPWDSENSCYVKTLKCSNASMRKVAQLGMVYAVQNILMDKV